MKATQKHIRNIRIAAMCAWLALRHAPVEVQMPRLLNVPGGDGEGEPEYAFDTYPVAYAYETLDLIVTYCNAPSEATRAACFADGRAAIVERISIPVAAVLRALDDPAEADRAKRAAAAAAAICASVAAPGDKLKAKAEAYKDEHAAQKAIAQSMGERK